MPTTTQNQTASAGQNRAHKTDYRKTFDGVIYTASKNFGFLDAEDVAIIAKADRLRQLLVRCGGCRFVCAAQDFAHLSACIVAGGDYVRDVSLPAHDKAMTAEARQKAESAQRMAEFNARMAKVAPITGEIAHLLAFREEDCGGAFDGNTVTSDADPGL